MIVPKTKHTYKKFKILHCVVLYLPPFCIVLSEFPSECTSFDSPHTLQCYKSLWEKYGCIEDGNISPSSLDEVNNAALQEMNLL